jgi:hypothetical protein
MPCVKHLSGGLDEDTRFVAVETMCRDEAIMVTSQQLTATQPNTMVTIVF